MVAPIGRRHSHRQSRQLQAIRNPTMASDKPASGDVGYDEWPEDLKDLRSVLDDVRAVASELNGRINADTILVRVVK